MQSTITDDGTGTGQSLIGSINDALERRIGRQRFRIWFKNSTRLALADGFVKVGVANLFIAGWIENHFGSEIIEAVRSVTGKSARITFGVDPELLGNQRHSQLDCRAQLVTGSPARLRRDAPRSPARPHGASKTLKLRLDTFVVGPSNELAYNAAKAVVRDKQSPFNPLFVHGGYGVGKTHLLQGICDAVSRSRPDARWIYLSAEDFVNQFVLALKTRKLEAFRRRMRQTDLLAIDDIHFLASKPSTQAEFLHTFNTIDLAGNQVVMASDAHPKMIGQLSEKLVNRFVSGMVVKIKTPDFKTRCEICSRYAKDLKKHVPESVIQYIAENLQTNVRELQGALIKLIAFASLQNSRIDLHMARAVLAEHIERCDPVVQISDIESAVATFFGITPAGIHSTKKDRTVALARHFSMYLARKHTEMSSSQIGRCMGNKNHATVLMACKKITEQLKLNTQLNWHGQAGNKISKARTILAKLEKSLAG